MLSGGLNGILKRWGLRKKQFNLSLPYLDIELARAIREMEVITGIEYLAEVTKDKFLRVRNIGKQTWHEFTQLRGLEWGILIV